MKPGFLRIIALGRPFDYDNLAKLLPGFAVCLIAKKSSVVLNENNGFFPKYNLRNFLCFPERLYFYIGNNCDLLGFNR
jgi:hypothetical protein